MCVDMIMFPFGSMILIGCVTDHMFTAADSSTIKCLVAPEYEKAHVTALSNLIVLKMVFAIESSCRLLAWTMRCLDVARVVACRGSCEIWSLLALVPRASLL